MGGGTVQGRSASPGQGDEVLYIEDNRANAALMEALFASDASLSLTWAPTAREGLELVRSRLPALVLLDLHLPDADGGSVLRELKQAEATRHIPVIVVSADAREEHALSLIADGADAYLTKPIDIREVLDVVHRAIGSDGAG